MPIMALQKIFTDEIGFTHDYHVIEKITLKPQTQKAYVTLDGYKDKTAFNAENTRASQRTFVFDESDYTDIANGPDVEQDCYAKKTAQIFQSCLRSWSYRRLDYRSYRNHFLSSLSLYIMSPEPTRKET